MKKFVEYIVFLNILLSNICFREPISWVYGLLHCFIEQNEPIADIRIESAGISAAAIVCSTRHFKIAHALHA